MKKIFLSICFIAATTLAFAQKPAEGDHSVTFGMTGINNIGFSNPTPTGTLMFRHYFKDNVALRFGISYTSSSHTPTKDLGYDTTDVNAGITTHTTWTGTNTCTRSTTNIGVSVGVQYCFKGTDRLETYIGADIYFGSGSSKVDTTYDKTEKVVQSSSTLTTTTTDVYHYNATQVYPTITKIGFIPCFGINYYFTDWLAVGAEFGWGFISTSSKAETVDEHYTTSETIAVSTGPTPTPAAPVDNVYSYKGGTAKTSGLQLTGHGMLTVTAAFR